MKYEIHDNKKTVTIFLSKNERNDDDLKYRLKPVYAQAKAIGYQTVVMLSGEEDLYELTLEVLRRNRYPDLHKQN